MLEKIDSFYNKITKYLGYVLFIVMITMTLNVFYDVVMRYVFNRGSIAMQELEWHQFSVLILLGMSYSLMEEAHVRVDVIYDRWRIKTKAMVNMMGSIVFVLPIALLVAFNSVDFVMASYSSHEISMDPGGLTHRWIIKALIPASFWILIFFDFGYFIKNLNIYKKAKEDEKSESGDREWLE